MKPKNVIVWILLLVIVVLAMSAGVQAQELREVPASEILEKIQAGEDVNYDGCRITGELDLSEIELETVPVARTEFEIEQWGLEEDLKIAESKITIINSVFENDMDLSSTQFKKSAVFYGTSFLNFSDFEGASFGGNADFRYASFDGDANFESASFDGDAYFWNVSFGGNADFLYASFGGDADFLYASFGGDANFRGTSFGGYTNFFDTNFDGDADFRGTSFGGYTNFWNTSFAGDADFLYASFGGYTNFFDASFDGDVNFWSASFGGDVHFFDTSFDGDVNFWSASFVGVADFRYASFGGNVLFEHMQFNKVFFSDTTFTNVSLHETDFKSMRVDWSSLKDTLVFDGPAYIKLVKNFREMEQFGDADDAYYQYRRLSQANKEWSFSKLGDILMWLSCGYGVKPQYTIILAVILILIFTIIYWLGNGIKRLKESDEDDEQDVSFCDAFYFSVVTFTTVGYGDWYPKDRYRKFVMIEGLVGWLTLALFLVTLANVMIRP
jgi:uncharacterized protein YjbI with pentapeptide repeats